MKVYIITDQNGEGMLIPSEPEVFLHEEAWELRWADLVSEALKDLSESWGEPPEDVLVTISAEVGGGPDYDPFTETVFFAPDKYELRRWEVEA